MGPLVVALGSSQGRIRDAMGYLYLMQLSPPLAARKSLISRSAVCPRKSSYAGVVNPFTRLFFAGTRSMRRELPGRPLKLNASLTRNRSSSAWRLPAAWRTASKVDGVWRSRGRYH